MSDSNTFKYHCLVCLRNINENKLERPIFQIDTFLTYTDNDIENCNRAQLLKNDKIFPELARDHLKLSKFEKLAHELTCIKIRSDANNLIPCHFSAEYVITEEQIQMIINGFNKGIKSDIDSLSKSITKFY